MTDIFLSRPTWVPPEYEEGLNNFLRLLNNLMLEPHTIGTTEYPINSPMDEVIEKMEQTSGVLILGYPQIFMSAGDIKDQKITSSVSLATEWNHIEASLAYSRKLPLLIIHDLTVIRGIFDRGAINKFVYKKDLKNSAWALSEEINGAIRSWKKKIESYSNREEYYQNYPLKVSNLDAFKADNLSREAIDLLKEAVKDDYGIILNTSTFDGRSITTNNKDMNKVGNPRDESLWEAALEELISYKLVKPAGTKGESFKVTNKGFDLSDKV